MPMSERAFDNTWQEKPEDIITLVNHSSNNYILEMPSGRCRLDSGRRLRTLRSVMNIPQVKQLVENGTLGIE